MADIKVIFFCIDCRWRIIIEFLRLAGLQCMMGLNVEDIVSLLNSENPDHLLFDGSEISLEERNEYLLLLRKVYNGSIVLLDYRPPEHPEKLGVDAYFNFPLSLELLAYLDADEDGLARVNQAFEGAKKAAIPGMVERIRFLAKRWREDHSARPDSAQLMIDEYRETIDELYEYGWDDELDDESLLPRHLMPEAYLRRHSPPDLYDE